MGDTVLYEAADAVATLTLNRPQRLNAITPALVEDFGGALARARSTRTICAKLGVRSRLKRARTVGA